MIQDIGVVIARFSGSVLTKGAVMMTITTIVFLMVRRASAAVRHMVLVAGVAAVSLATVASALITAWPATTNGGVQSFTVASQIFGDAGVSGTVQQVMGAAKLAGNGPWAAWLAVVWGGVATFLLVRLVADARAASLLVKASFPVQDARLLRLRDELVKRFCLPVAPQLLMSAQVSAAATARVLRPVVLVASEALQWSDERARAVLAHELAHVARRDCFTQVVAGITCALHWPNPLCWWASRRIRAEREMAADDIALASGATASTYASDLMTFARAAGRGTQGAVLAIATSSLGERIERLVDAQRSRRRVGRILVAAAAVATLAVSVPIACMRSSNAEDRHRGEPLWVAFEADDSAGAGQTLFENVATDSALKARGISVTREEWSVDGASRWVTFATASQQVLRSYVASLPSVPDYIIAVGPHDDELWRTHVVDIQTRLILSDYDVAVAHNDESGRPEVALHFGAQDAQRMRDLTTANLGRRMVLVAAGRVLAAPVLRATISDTAIVSVGTADPATAEKEVRLLVEQLTPHSSP